MRRLSSIVIVLFAFAAQALVLDTPLPDARQEQRAQQLFHAMRCIVCEGQSLAESDAMFAVEMRGEIRRRIHDGQNPDDIKNYFVVRYGERILQSPPLSPRTYLLWSLPVLFLLIAGWLLRPKRRKS